MLRRDEKIKRTMRPTQLLFLALALAGCASIAELDKRQKLEYYECWWPCVNEVGKTGFCCEKEVPEEDHYIFNCEDAPNRIINGTS
jgi:hypothetical protein